MKKIFFIGLLFISSALSAQNIRVPLLDTTSHQPIGSTIIKPLGVSTPNYLVNDSTIGSHAIDSIKRSSDSILARKDGQWNFQYKDSTGGGGVSNWTLTGNDIYNNNSGKVGVGISAPLARLHVTSNSIGVTQTTANSILFENTTAATSGNPQWSPSLILSGKQWNTVGTASQDLSFRLTTKPQSGGNVQGTFNLEGSTNGGAYTFLSSWDLKTLQFTNAGQIVQTSAGNLNAFSSPLNFNGATTNRYVSFASTSIVSFGQNNTTQNLTFRVPGVLTSNPTTTGNQAMDIHYLTGQVMVNSEAIDTGAVFNVRSTNGNRVSIPYPRMTSTQRDSINLKIASVVVDNAGSGYTSNPVVTALGVFPDIAANLVPVRTSNTVTSINVTIGGSYSSTPTITITGGGGTGATAHAVMTQGTIPIGGGIYCTNCTATDSSTGVVQIWNGTTWKNAW